MKSESDRLRPVLKALLLGQDSDALAVLRDRLTTAGWTIQVVRHPSVEAVTGYRTLLVVDLVVPRLDGREVLRSLEAQPELAQIPFVVLTEALDLKDDVRLLQAGALDVWRKPFQSNFIGRLAQGAKEAQERAALPPGQRARLALLKLARAEGLSGTLTVNPGTLLEGRVIFNAGQLTTARLGRVTGEPALDELLTLDHTVWRFEPGVTRDLDQDSSPALTPAGRRPSVLLVEDDPELLAMGAKRLEHAGFKVETAAQGQLGYDLAATNEFDLIIADLNMPVLDGWGMLRLLGFNPLTREVPVLVLSAHDDYRETLKAAQAGAHGYLAKSGKGDELIQQARMLTAARQSTWGLLEAGKEVGSIELTAVGPRWLLMTLGRFGASATIEAVDDLGRWEFEVEKGHLKSATAKTEDLTHDGDRAVFSFLGARGARAFVRGQTASGSDLSQFPLVLEVVDRVCSKAVKVAQLMLDAGIESAVKVTFQPQLYRLFLQVCSNAQARIARAIVEEQIAIAELSHRTGATPDEVHATVSEMFRRDVIVPAA